MASLFINSYAPLAISSTGRIVSLQFDLPPFIDGSIRREPDLEHDFPSVSCLCRAGKFAPRLQAGDMVVYLTKKNRFGACDSSRRMTALLEVMQRFDTHAAGAMWYREQELPLPSNCLVPGNPPQPWERSHQQFVGKSCSSDAATHRQWDQSYRARVRLHPVFVVCRPLFVDVSWNAPVVSDLQLISALGKVPSTQNPARLSISLLKPLLKQLRLAVPPSVP